MYLPTAIEHVLIRDHIFESTSSTTFEVPLCALQVRDHPGARLNVQWDWGYADEIQSAIDMISETVDRITGLEDLQFYTWGALRDWLFQPGECLAGYRVPTNIRFTNPRQWKWREFAKQDDADRALAIACKDAHDADCFALSHGHHYDPSRRCCLDADTGGTRSIQMHRPLPAYLKRRREYA